MAAAGFRDFPVGWDELHRNARALAWRLIDLTPPGGWTGIVAVARGGLVPAAIIARELDIRLVDTVCVATYDHQTKGEPRLLKHIDSDGLGLMVVDDLVDTGTTFRLVRQVLPRAHFATVYAKPAGKPLVDTWVTEVSQDTWIHFPWDVTPQFSQPLITSRGN